MFQTHVNRYYLVVTILELIYSFNLIKKVIKINLFSIVIVLIVYVTLNF